MRRTGRWVPIGCGLLLVLGCSTAVDGDALADDTSTSTSAAAPTTPWDPCTIPDEAIERAGLNASTKESGIFGRDQNGFKICGWESSPPDDEYFLRIFVGFESLDFVDDPSYFDRLQPVRVGTRDALRYQQLSADASRDCGVAFTAGPELIRATLITSALVQQPSYDPCTELSTVVAALDSELPS